MSIRSAWKRISLQEGRKVKDSIVKGGIGVIAFSFLILAIFLGALLFKKYEDAKAPPPPAAAQKGGLVTATLFFASLDGDGLVREGREIEPCDEVSECLEEILEQIINGPVNNSAPVLPLTGMFNSVKLDGVTARVDFAQELLDALPSGSNSELYAAYSVINSICYNYPQVQQVVFTVDGKPRETLKGHLDISSAIAPDFSLEKKAERPPINKGK
jgi:sporulation and spore germination protein